MSTAEERRCHLCQTAHRNEGKGMGLKTPPYMTARICQECHHEIDNGKNLSRDERRAMIDKAIVLTHAWLIENGLLILKR
jgi:hypothetical protein